MKSKQKKSQVDVALTIGSIIIPVAALFGSLVFAFVMISQYADAARLAGVISYDIATLADVVYSVPDSIKVYYKPPSMCEFSGNMITCLNGFMNLSDIKFKTEVQSTQLTEREGRKDIPYSLDSHFYAVVPKEAIENKADLPFEISYPAYANMKDQAIADKGENGIINIDINNSLIIQKNREGIFDTLSPAQAYNEKDPLYQVISTLISACKSGENKNSSSITLPHNYNFLVPDAQTLQFIKITQSPLDPTSNVKEEYSSEDCNGETIKVYKYYTINLTTVYQVNLPSDLDKYCNFKFNDPYLVDSKGNDLMNDKKCYIPKIEFFAVNAGGYKVVMFPLFEETTFRAQANVTCADNKIAGTADGKYYCCTWTDNNRKTFGTNSTAECAKYRGEDVRVFNVTLTFIKEEKTTVS